MHKIFLSDKNKISCDIINIFGEDFNHIKALRLKIKDEIIICDGDNQDYFCIIKEIYKDHAELLIKTIKQTETESKNKIFLFQAMPKQDKLEFIIQKSVELGVNKIIPMITDYSDIKKMPSDNKILRWTKIAKSAAEQSGRGIIPEILAPTDFKTALSFTKNIDKNIIAHEKSNSSIKKYLTDTNIKNKSISIFIGPEGGFSEQEINLARQNNIIPVSLGKRILRTETASVFILSIIIFLLEL